MATETMGYQQPTVKKKSGSIKGRRAFSNIVVYFILSIMGVIWILPILWLVLQSFSGAVVGQSGLTEFIPSTWSFESYWALFTNHVIDKTQTYVVAGDPSSGYNWITSSYNFFLKIDKGNVQIGAFFYTLIIAFFTAIISTLLTLSTSYAFSRLRFKGRTGMMKVILLMGMFPGFLGLIVLYQIFKILGLLSTSTGPMWALIIIYSGGAGMGYYISKGFFDTISKQIDEAAMVDGATRFQIFYKITLPLSKPIVVYTVLTAFMGPWAEYITASYMIRSGAQNYNTGGVVTVAVQLFDMLDETTNRSQYWGQFCCGAVIVAIPTSILFVMLQKNYVSGVTGGAVKG